ncbi:putative Postreplication repair E3 ubiquitin-protein ligase RAD18 [Seiridium unicorne]|uniref:Postreplication repair E3 ubiquitin-protein ligase RAD18 n=1 Tax=Seiridium unicorne TaxID=138068 RepID=A0ABR2VA68_9PEZI
MNDQGSVEVSDSTDWLTTPLPGLAAVESALRCQVCKDFYKTPMLTSCNHTFCSLCIRRALSNDGKCPLCRANEQEIRLRSNWSMEEVVGAFMKTRQTVLELAQKPQTSLVQTVTSPKRRLEDITAEELREPKRLRSSARLSASRGALATAEMARQEVDVFTPQEEETNFDDGLVACPICLTRMKETQVDRHLDNACPGSPQPESRRKPNSRDQSILMNGYQSVVMHSSKAIMKRPDRLPTVNYSMLKDAQLRKKLAELGISTLGDRKMLERRHREWMTIWNANCDALHPRKKADLLQDLNTWENTLGSRAPTASRSINLGVQIKDKDFDHQAWSTQHDSSFRDLIANARKNVVKAKQIAKAESSDSAPLGTSETPHTDQDHSTPNDTQVRVIGVSSDKPISIHDGEPPAMPIAFRADAGLPTLEPADASSSVDRIANQMS